LRDECNRASRGRLSQIRPRFARVGWPVAAKRTNPDALRRYAVGVPMIVLLGLAVFVVGVDSYIVAAVLPAVADDLREPVSNVGLVASAYALPVAILSPVFGPLSDRRGRRFAMLLGLAIFAAAAAACIVAPNLPLLLGARAINGIGAAILLPAAFAAAGDLPTEAARGRAIALVTAAFPLSNLLGLPFGALATSLGGWRAPFGLIAGAAVVAFVGVATSNQVSRTANAGRGYTATFGRVIRDRNALAVMSVTLVWFSGAVGLFIYVGEFIHESFGIASEQAGLAYLVIGVVGLVAARTSSVVLARIGPRRTVLIGISLFGTAAFLLPLTTIALPLALGAIAIWAFGTWFGVPGMQTIVAGLSESARGTMLAFNSSALNLGGVIGPLITGRILDVGGFGWAGPWSAFLAACAFVIAWRVLPRHAQADDTAGVPMAAA
jgi:DHA1 family inner membrane transport protein